MTMSPRPPTEFEIDKDTEKAIQQISVAKYNPSKYDSDEDVMPTLGADNGLKLADLTGKGYDDPNWEKLLDQLSLEDMITLINTGGWKTAPIESVGKVATSDCDGPAGLSNYVTHTTGTQFPLGGAHGPDLEQGDGGQDRRRYGPGVCQRQ